MSPADRRRRLRREARSGGTSAGDPGSTAGHREVLSYDLTSGALASRRPARAAGDAAGASGAPWLRREARRLASCIVASYGRGFGQPLLAPVDSAHLAQELFALDTVVLAHDGADPGGDPGPRLIYANAAALRLWRRPWAEQVGLPSRLTAEAQERPDRARMLHTALEQHAIRGYCGIRIDSQGRRFQIRNARLWTLWDEHGRPCGQAAAFNDWWWL